MSPEPRIRDLTDSGASLSVVVGVSPVYELLLTLFMYQTACLDPDDVENRQTIGTIEDLLGAPARTALNRVSGSAKVWAILLGVASRSRPSTAAEFADQIAATDPVELRRQILTDAGFVPSGGHDAESIERAAHGDTSGLDTGSDPADQGLLRLLDLSPASTTELLVAALRTAAADLGPRHMDQLPYLEREGAVIRAMADTMSATEVVEAATSGVTFEWQPGIAGVLLIPSLVIAPWVVTTEHQGFRIFCYPVSDVARDLDPGAPPAALVKILKALADEKRLRLLFMLGEGQYSLGELADKIDLAKSTTHHHIRALRTAGLIRVVVDHDKQVIARAETIPELNQLLDDYLSAAHPTSEIPEPDRP